MVARVWHVLLRPPASQRSRLLSTSVALREQDCHLPAIGWGRLTLVDNRPQAGKRWTDSGEVHDRRGLKHRAAADSRVVPIPPDLVGILRRHVDRFGVANDGRLFRSGKGNVVAASTYLWVWKAARDLWSQRPFSRSTGLPVPGACSTSALDAAPID